MSLVKSIWNQVLFFLEGKKTYSVAAILAAVSFVQEANLVHIPQFAAVVTFLIALLGAALRAGISKV